jgi:hypothetical protein
MNILQPLLDACPTCREQVAIGASACPRCGSSSNRRVATLLGGHDLNVLIAG